MDSLFKNANQKLTRQNINDINEPLVITGRDETTGMVEYLDGDQSPKIINAIVKRFCTTVKKSDDGFEEYEADPIATMEAAVKLGLFEVVTVDAYRKIAYELASLTRNTSFEYPDSDDDFKAAFEFERERGGFGLKLGRADVLSTATGSSCLLVQELGGRLDYQPIAQNRIWFVFGNTIDDGGIKRPVNTQNINEASQIIIELSRSNNESNFIAFLPRQDCLENGRCVRYSATKFDDIPEVGSPLANETENDAGEPANPLTVLQNRNEQWANSEVPVVVWRGSLAQVGVTLLPFDGELYKQGLELDVSASRVLTSGSKSATGMTVFSTEMGASPLPPTGLGEGFAQLRPGGTVNLLAQPVSNSVGQSDIINRAFGYLADARGVPPYRVVVKDNAVAPSGEALKEMDKPAHKTRQDRHTLNSPAMNQLFEIEKSIIAISNDDPTWAQDVKQLWICHDEKYTQTRKEVLEYIKLELDAGLTDRANALVATSDKFNTREDAQEWLNSLVAAPVAAAAPRFGSSKQ